MTEDDPSAVWCPQEDLNLRRRRERAVSWARLDDRDVKTFPHPVALTLADAVLKMVSRGGIEPTTI